MTDIYSFLTRATAFDFKMVALLHQNHIYYARKYIDKIMKQYFNLTSLTEILVMFRFCHVYPTVNNLK